MRAVLRLTSKVKRGRCQTVMSQLVVFRAENSEAVTVAPCDGPTVVRPCHGEAGGGESGPPNESEDEKDLYKITPYKRDRDVYRATGTESGEALSM